MITLHTYSHPSLFLVFVTLLLNIYIIIWEIKNKKKKKLRVRGLPVFVLVVPVEAEGHYKHGPSLASWDGGASAEKTQVLITIDAISSLSITAGATFCLVFGTPPKTTPFKWKTLWELFSSLSLSLCFFLFLCLSAVYFIAFFLFTSLV